VQCVVLDQTQVPEYRKRSHGASEVAGQPKYDNGVCKEECDCGDLPCGNYIYNHANTSLAEWFVSVGGPIINNRTLMQPGVVAYYIDDSFWHKGFKQGGGTGGVTETSGKFANDTGMDYTAVVAFAEAYERNMETLYDNIVEQGGWVVRLSLIMLGKHTTNGPIGVLSHSLLLVCVPTCTTETLYHCGRRQQWQLFQDGPNLLGGVNGKPMAPSMCASVLRTNWCTSNGTAERSGVLYATHPTESRQYNDTNRNELVVAEFLLTRGNWSFIGTDWNGCSSSSSFYPRM
jgi:hypothetical protein